VGLSIFRSSQRGAANSGLRLALKLLRIGRDERGATLVEFSIIALPFFILMLGIFEIGFRYWANKELDDATSTAARLVRTGQVQAANMSAADLKAEICSHAAVLIDCTSRMRLDVRSAETFGAITPPSPLNAGGTLKADNDFTFSPGSGEDVVLISAFFDWPALFFGSSLLRAAMPARNEPF
jgi:Flp pilus assembly protein TadG